MYLRFSLVLPRVVCYGVESNTFILCTSVKADFQGCTYTVLVCLDRIRLNNARTLDISDQNSLRLGQLGYRLKMDEKTIHALQKCDPSKPSMQVGWAPKCF